MKKKCKRVLSIFLCMVLSTTMFFSIGVREAIAESDCYLYGYITDLEEDPLEDIEVVVTNLETEESVTVYTDENGFYEVDFQEEQWEPEFDVQIKTDFQELVIAVLYDEVFRGDIFISDILREGEPDPTDWPSLDLLTTSPYIGKVHVFHDPNYGTGTSHDCTENFEWFSKTNDEGKVSISMDLKYEDKRYLPNTDMRAKPCIQTKHDDETEWTTKQGVWINGSYHPPENYTHDSYYHRFDVQGSFGTNITLNTKGGYIAQEYIEFPGFPEYNYWADKSGKGGADHYCKLMRTY